MVCIVLGSLAHQAYGKGSTVETFQCQYGLNERYRESLNDGNLKITGRDKEGQARIIEIQSHPFFLASLFLPQMSSKPGRPHPLIRSFIETAATLKAG
jgi:CTP synthase (UTP-ammonia lyase)